jgi:hypothetical protein
MLSVPLGTSYENCSDRKSAGVAFGGSWRVEDTFPNIAHNLVIDIASFLYMIRMPCRSAAAVEAVEDTLPNIAHNLVHSTQPSN